MLDQPPPTHRPPTKCRLYGTLFLWICIYSGWNIIGRDVSTEGPVLRLLVINCLRALVASLCCLLLMLCQQAKMPSLSNPKETTRWLALGLVTFVMNNLYTLGLRWTTATNCAIFIATTPLWTYLGGVCFGMEILDQRWRCRAIGFLLAVVGALIVESGRATTSVHMGTTNFFRVFGNIVVLFAVVSISSYYLVVRSLASTSNHSALAITMVAQISAFVYSACFIVGLLAAREEQPNASLSSIVHELELNWDVVYSGVYAGVCINVVCFGIEAWALKYASPGTVALFTALDPPFTAVLSVIFLHESASFTLFIGGALIVSGLFVNAGVEEYGVAAEGTEGSEDGGGVDKDKERKRRARKRGRRRASGERSSGAAMPVLFSDNDEEEEEEEEERRLLSFGEEEENEFY